jgi:RNA polymerase sigma factor (sigma-70 family)
MSETEMVMTPIVAAETDGESNTAEFHSLLLEHRRSIFLFCLGFARNQAEAQDLTQETLTRALGGRSSKPSGHPRAWLLRIARNTCIDQARRSKVRRFFRPWIAVGDGGDPSPHQRLEQAEAIDIVRQSIKALPTAQRDVLVLREYNDLSYREIADVLGISEGTVMSRLNRARRAVLNCYQERHDGQ